MGMIMRRLIRIFRSWLHALLAPAEDPRKAYAAAYQRQQELLLKVRQAQSNIVASKDKLQTKTAEAREKLPQMEGQARQALLAGREDLARFTLQLRQVAVEEIKSLDAQVVELEQQGQVVSLVEQRLATQIEAFFARQEVIAARYSTAEAQVQVHEALGGVSEELADLGKTLERAEERTENMQARVTAIDRLVEMGVLEAPGRTAGAGPVPELAVPESADAVEDKLASLRQEIEAG